MRYLLIEEGASRPRGDSRFVNSRKAPTHSNVEAQRRLAYFDERRDEIVATIRELVEIESPSDNKAAVDRIAEAVAHKFSQLDGELRVHPAKDFGNHLQIDFDFAGKSVGKSAAKPVLLLGHYDTVYPLRSEEHTSELQS